MKKTYILRIIAIGVIVASITAAWFGLKSYLLNSPDFKLVDIEILPAGQSFRHLDRTEILKACGLEQSSWPSIFGINLSQIKNRLESHPWIEKAEVKRVLPGQLWLRIKEREGIARVRIRGRFFLIDSSGTVLPDVQNIPTYDHPLVNIKDIRLKEPEIGKELDSRRLQICLRALEQLKQKRFIERYPVLTISPLGNNGISFVLANSKIEVRMLETEVDSQIDILEQLLLNLQDEINKVSYVDLRFKEPVVGKK